MLSCTEIRDQLILHVGGDLDPIASARVDQHLRGCLGCFREHQQLAGLRTQVRELKERGAFPRRAGFVDDVMRNLARIPRTGRSTWVTRSAWVAAAAMVVLGVLVRMQRVAPAPVSVPVSNSTKPTLFSPYMISDRPESARSIPTVEGFSEARFRAGETVPPPLFRDDLLPCVLESQPRALDLLGKYWTLSADF